MNQGQSKNRKIQILRGIAISAVVVIHTYPQNKYGVFIRAFVNFAVSLFFFLSGYLTKIENNDWKALWERRITRVFIPYVIWSVLWVAVQGNFSNFIFKLLTGETVYPYYFVFVYIQFMLFMPLIARLAKSEFKWTGWLIQPIAIIVLRYFGVEKYLPFSVLFSWFGPYYLGLLLGNQCMRWKYNYKTTAILWLVSFALSTVEGLLWYKAGNYNMATTQLRLSNCFYSIICLLVAYEFINDDSITGTSRVAGITASLGDYSFGIFLIHPFVIKILQKLFPYKYLFFPINTAVVITVTAFCVWCGRALLGKKYGKYFGLF